MEKEKLSASVSELASQFEQTMMFGASQASEDTKGSTDMEMSHYSSK